jgi:hypothetical protein
VTFDSIVLTHLATERRHRQWRKFPNLLVSPATIVQYFRPIFFGRAML